MTSSGKAAALGFAAALSLGTLAACSTPNDEPSDGTVAIQVAMDTGLDAPAIAAFDARIEQFEKANPGISVEHVEYTWDATTFAAGLAGGTLPDVFPVPFTDGRGLIAHEQIADVSALVAELPYADRYNPHVSQAGEDEDGDIWAIPIAAYSQGLHYNRALFTQAGLDPDDPPSTWDEVRQDAKAIADATGQAGYATMTQSNTGGWILTTLVNAMGGSVEEFDGSAATATIDTPEMRSALDYLRTLRWTDGSMGSNFLYDWGGINQAFASGQIGMYVSGGGNYGNLFTQNALDPSVYGLTVLPLEGADAGVLGGGTLAAVNAKATEAEQAAAVKWIDFYYMQKLFDEEAAVLDAQTSAAADQPVGAPQLPVFDQATYAEQQSWIAEYVNVPLEQMTGYTDHVFEQPLLAEPARSTQDLYAALDPVVQSVLTDQDADIDQLLDAAQTQVQSLLDQG